VGQRKDASTSRDASTAGQTGLWPPIASLPCKKNTVGGACGRKPIVSQPLLTAGGVVLTAYEEHVGTYLGASTACQVDVVMGVSWMRIEWSGLRWKSYKSPFGLFWGCVGAWRVSVALALSQRHEAQIPRQAKLLVT
jgi:hypothetical protein